MSIDHSINIEEKPILIVEDNAADVVLIRRVLEKVRLANPLQIVSHGDAAVDYLAGQGMYADRKRFPLPILILLDLELPRRSGIQVLQWLRQQPGLQHIPVTILTLSQQDRDVNAAYDIGITSYLVKPIHLDGLLQLLKTTSLRWLLLDTPPAPPPDADADAGKT
jgi:CheY-like chemotaxis protein